MSQQTDRLLNDDEIQNLALIGRRFVDLVDDANIIRGTLKGKPFDGLTDAVPEEQSVPHLIVIPDGTRPDWIKKAMDYYQMDEAEDEEILTTLLGFNPNEKTGGMSWCTGFANACYEACGIQGTGSLDSLSFRGWGQECQLIEFALLVFRNKEGDGGHVGWAVKVDGVWKVLGGNQRNMVKYSNLAWYLANMNLVWCAWPLGYAIPKNAEVYSG